MARCPVWRLLLLPAVCLIFGLGGCAGGINPAARNSTNLRNKSEVVTENWGKKSSTDSVISKNAIFPSEIEGLQLISFTTGEEACTLMSGFLGAGCNIKEAYVVGYQGKCAELVLWIVEMVDEPGAVALLEKMNNRIKTSPAFTGYQCIEDEKLGSIYYARVREGHPIFTHNYLYNRWNQVYLVNLSGDIPLAMLKRILSRIQL